MIVESILMAGGFWMILSVCPLLLLLVLLIKRGRFLYALRKIPYPIALPIIGNAYQLNCSSEEFFQNLIRWAEEFGSIYLIWVGLRPFIFLYKVEAVQLVLGSSMHNDKSLEYTYLKPWLGTGLVTSNGETWQFRRKLLTPTFHSGLLATYFKIAKEETNVLISCLEKESNKFDVVPYLKRATLDIICQSAMGYKLNAQINSKNEYVEAVDKIASIVQMRFTNVWVSNDKIFKLTKAGKEHDHALRIIQDLVDKVIAQKKIEWQQKHDGSLNKPLNKKQVLLDLLLDISKNGTVHLSDADIRDEVNTFMYAGHDTMATSISWTLYALGRHPEYQEKILDEYYNTLGTTEVTLQNIHKLTWLDACIKEQWRIYPVAPLIARQIYKPINLNADIRDEVNTFMYAGHDTMATSISWTLYALGRHPEYQEKILDEYYNTLGTTEVTLQNIHKLTWLDACIKEQWRIYPVAPLIARQIYKPINLMGNEIPPGSTVLINSYLLHRDSRFFPDPHIYRPERFLPNSPKLPPYSFIPFSAGSRNCIGSRFATSVIKVAVLSVLKAFRVEASDTQDQLRFKSELVLVNANGHRLKITPR
ncbi:Cytochrome P450 4g15 [Camponotus floridanus]|uniref:Cytochrome P450 4g15 n=1 Tax=Camponotus floridanus TaxID=104421 RepID=E2AIJ7_CAMFO|nr:Cytochrome P450 4g15 [Camponotus floridanus]